MARIWIYQADRFLSDDEVKDITTLSTDFVSSWTAHGSALAGKAYVLDNIFLILEVDEEIAGVTGCSIDKSVHFIKALGQKFNIDFFDRMRVVYYSDEQTISLASRDEFQELVNKGVVNQDTLVYNNLIQTNDQLATEWKVPFAKSWHSKVF